MGARLVATNLLIASGVTITASTSATGYSPDNLASPAGWKRWRSAKGNATEWVKFDLGSAKSFQLLAAIHATLHTGGTLHAQANATDSWSSPTVNELLTVPSLNLTGVLAKWLTSVQTLRWVRFLFTNTGSLNEYVELGVGIAGTYLEPKMSIAPGFGLTRVDPSVQRFAIGGQRSVVTRPKYHAVSGQFRLQSVAARDAFRSVWDSNGISVPVLFSLDPNAPSLTFYGSLREMQTNHRETSGDLWDVPFAFAEEVP